MIPRTPTRGRELRRSTLTARSASGRHPDRRGIACKNAADVEIEQEADRRPGLDVAAAVFRRSAICRPTWIASGGLAGCSPAMPVVGQPSDIRCWRRFDPRDRGDDGVIDAPQRLPPSRFVALRCGARPFETGLPYHQ
jgi:hypothetical protein